MSNVVVIYKGDDWKKEIPFKSVPTRNAFEDWHTRALKHGANMFRSSIDWYDPEKNVFKKAWAFRDGKWQKIEREITPDLIFDKMLSKRNYEYFDYKMKISKKVKIFNSPQFRSTFDNKLNQYLLFSEFMPETLLIKSNKEYKETLLKRGREKVVVKPLYGSGGFGIIIDSAENVLDKEVPDFPVIVQKFIKGRGIPGFSKKEELADLRLIYFGRNVIYALSRVAKRGSLFTNFHQGAEAKLVPKQKIPTQVIAISKKISEKVSVFGECNYSLDFLFDEEGRAYLMEMNTTPGFDLLKIVGDNALLDKNLKALLEVVDK